MKEELEKSVEDVIAELNHLVNEVLLKADVKRLADMLRKIYERT